MNDAIIIITGGLLISIEGDKEVVLADHENHRAERSTSAILLPDLLIKYGVYEHQETMKSKHEPLSMIRNPGSRRLPLGDEYFIDPIYQLHQVSRYLLLIQRMGKDWQDWVLMSTNGTKHRISSELLEALQGSHDVQSFRANSSKCQLLISYKEPVA